MEFDTPSGPRVIVEEREAGNRLRGFAQRAFREHLGRQQGRQHCSARKAASTAKLLVDQVPHDGRIHLQEGQVVTLAVLPAASHPAMLTPSTSAPAITEVFPSGRARMSYAAEPCGPYAAAAGTRASSGLQYGLPNGPDSTTGNKGSCPGGDDNKTDAEAQQQQQRVAGIFCDVSAGFALFQRYYSAQGIAADPLDWDEVLSRFREPIPLTLRANLSIPSYHWQSSITNLRALFGDRIQPLPWAPGAWQLC